MTKLNKNIVDNLIAEEKYSQLMKAFEVKEYAHNDVDIKQYDLSNIDGKNRLNGCGFKRFFRYNGTCFDDIKQELLANPKCSYITYFNNIARQGLLPQWISVLSKQSDMFRAYREIISSQILNYCGVPTCANLCLRKDKEFERTLVSIDFISENERFLNSEDLKLKYQEYSLESWLKSLSKSLGKIKIIRKNPEFKDKILKDVVYSYIVRKALLGDTDCNVWNMGMLINKKDNYLKLINFDYEYSCRHAQLIEGIEKDIEFVKLHFPEEYHKFIQKTDEIAQVLPKVKLSDRMVYGALVKNVDYIQSISQKTM